VMACAAGVAQMLCNVKKWPTLLQVPFHMVQVAC